MNKPLRKHEFTRGYLDGLTGTHPSGPWFEKPKRRKITPEERFYLQGFNQGRHDRERQRP